LALDLAAFLSPALAASACEQGNNETKNKQRNENEIQAIQGRQNRNETQARQCKDGDRKQK
jgi:hypothetical protein